MLPRTNRLGRSKDILAVLRSRQAARGEFLTIRWRPGSQGFRLTVVVSTKVSKRATIRNRLKRQLRAAFWDMRKEFPAPADYVVIVRPGSPLPTGSALTKDLRSLISAVRRRSRP